MRAGLYALADEVSHRLRARRYAAAVRVLIKNPDLKSISRQTAAWPSIWREIGGAALELVKPAGTGRAIRMLTVAAR